MPSRAWAARLTLAGSLPALAALGACTRRYTLPEFDALARTTSARTILLEERVSLYSPYDWARTRSYLEVIEKERAAVFELFGVESEEPTVVWLRVDPKLGVQVAVEGELLRIESVSMETHDGILGHADGSVVEIRVAPLDEVQLPGGRTITGTFDVSMYADTIRHELAHAAAFQRGLHGRGWLEEGLAHAVAWLPIEGGRLRMEPPPERLRVAAALPRELRSIANLLAWEQHFPPTDEDRASRLLAFSLVAFLLEREASPFRERVVRIAAFDEDRLLALQDAWSEWLDGITHASGGDES